MSWHAENYNITYEFASTLKEMAYVNTNELSHSVLFLHKLRTAKDDVYNIDYIMLCGSSCSVFASSDWVLVSKKLFFLTSTVLL
jgi:hypothetical protein